MTKPASSLKASQLAETGMPSRPRSAEAEDLIRRAPMGYVWNQLASLWLFLASFLFTVLATKVGKTPAVYGVLAAALTVYNTAVYVAAFGLEDAGSVFVPRALAEHGRAAAAAVIRRLLAARALCLALSCAGIFWGLPALAPLIRQMHWSGFLASELAGADRVPGLDSLAPAVAAYVFGTGLMNQIQGIFVALLRTRLTFVVGSLGQVANLAAVFAAIKLGYGVAGVLWGLALAAWLTALVYFMLLAPWWGYKVGRGDAQPFGPVLQLGGSAWLINLVNGALLKQVIISLFQYFLITSAVIGYFNLAFQLTHAAAYLLIAGLGGVGLAAMSAAYAGNDRPSLAVAWRAVSKVHILLSVPLLAFTFIYAPQIIAVLYGATYEPAGTLMRVFLIFNIVYLLAGGNAHQAALYVLGRQRLALLCQWVGLALTVILGFILIPQPGMWGGADGALIAIGAGQLGAVLAQLALTWRNLRAKYPIRFSMRVLLALIPPVLLAAFFHPRALLPAQIGSSHSISALLDLAISVILFTIVLVISLAVAKPIEHLDVDLLAQTNPRLRPILAPFASGAPSPMMIISKIPTRKITEKAVEQQEQAGDSSQTPTLRRSRQPSRPVIRMPIEVQQPLEE